MGSYLSIITLNVNGLNMQPKDRDLLNDTKTKPLYMLSTRAPLLCLEGVPDLPVAPQDEAGLTKTFQTWPRGWFHIP